MLIHAKRLLTPQGFQNDQLVTVEDGCIVSISPAGSSAAELYAEILTPGLIDLHVHGGEGFNARDFDLDRIEPFLEKMLACGVTDFLMTISTGHRNTMRHGLEVTRRAMALQKNGKLGGARILGVHLEGPFLSHTRPGAMQCDAILIPSIAAYQEMFDGYEDIIKRVSLAPEEEGADALIAYLLAQGVVVQAGHTDASFEQAQHGFACGVSSLCHTFNACRGIHHRDPGIVTAALLEPDIYCEAICDLEHLHGGALRLIYAMKGSRRMMLVSDSVVTHGMPDGEYFMEGYHIVVKDGISRTWKGALDGGGVYLDGAVRNIMSLGISAEDAIRMATATPAAHMALDSLGVIAIGKQAHLTAWMADWRTAFTVI